MSERNPDAVDLNSPCWLASIRKNLRGELVALVFPEVVPLTDLPRLEAALIRNEREKREYQASMARAHTANVAARAPAATPATERSVDELFALLAK